MFICNKTEVVSHNIQRSNYEICFMSTVALEFECPLLFFVFIFTITDWEKIIYIISQFASFLSMVSKGYKLSLYLLGPTVTPTGAIIPGNCAFYKMAIKGAAGCRTDGSTQWSTPGVSETENCMSFLSEYGRKEIWFYPTILKWMLKEGQPLKG